MTNVVFTRTPDALILTCHGHACYAEYGKDIVCAGISALCMALAQGLRFMDEQGLLTEHFCEYSDGYFRAAVSGKQTAAVSTVFETVYAGLCAVQDEYPENISCRKENSKKGVKV